MIGTLQYTKKFFLGAFFLVFFFGFFTQFSFDIHTAYAAPTEQSVTAAATPTENDSCWGSVGCFFSKVLYYVLVTIAFFASVAAYMFSYVIDVSHFQAIMNNPVIYEMWKIVRDFFNLFFIFSLLIIAFTTIFQVEKFGGLKGVWKIVLAALFINFSFPIARMIIDVGNVMMYSFITDIFGMSGKSLTDGILGGSGLMTIFLPGSNGAFRDGLELKFYFIAIICMFMFMVSFLTLSVMMLYRLVILPILVMFAPLGFAGALPGFAGYSKQWWDKLIKSVFFGPIAVFMMMIAVKFLATWGSSNKLKEGFSQTSIEAVNGTLISGVVYMTIPIIFFWIAITSAEKLSSAASFGMSNGFGSKFLKKIGNGIKDKSWGGTKFLGKKAKDVSWTNRFPGRVLAKRSAEQEEMKKYKEGIEKERLEAAGKPGKDAARGKMDEADKKIIDKGAANGASEKDKTAAKAALKRFNDRKRTANNEDIKKKRERLVESGADTPEALIASMRTKNEKSIRTLTRDERLARSTEAALYNERYSRMDRAEKEDFLVSGDLAKDFMGTDYDKISEQAKSTLTGADLTAYQAAETKYIAERGKAKQALNRLKNPSVYTGTPDANKKAMEKDRLVVEKFIKERTNDAIKDGDGHDTNRTIIS